MRTLVIFDSFFGNTEQIARAVTSNLGPSDQVRTCRIGEVKPGDLARLGCLVVGSPTRGFRPTPAIVNLLKAIPSDALRGVKVAAFDTRFAEGDIKSTALRVMVKFGGYAAAPMAALLKKKGGELIAPPEGFFVKDTEGPLKEGELERAAGWGRKLASA